MFDKDEYGKPQILKVIKIVDCIPGRADNKETGEKIAIISSTHGGKPDYPIMITIPDVQKLVVRLLNVLCYHDEAIPEGIKDVLFGDSEAIKRAISDTAPTPTSSTGPRVTPSKRDDMPVEPITGLDMARFWQKAGRAKNDAELLRLIGLTAKEIGRPRRNYPRRKRGK